MGKDANQRVTITTDGIQEVSNLKSFLIFFNNANTYCKKFNIQLSLDGENFETAYESTDDFTER